jgi:hypothetical protein
MAWRPARVAQAFLPVVRLARLPKNVCATVRTEIGSRYKIQVLTIVSGGTSRKMALPSRGETRQRPLAFFLDYAIFEIVQPGVRLPRI